MIKAIESALGFNLLSYNAVNTQDGQRMVLEYGFNLAKPEGRAAFDRLIVNTRSLKWLDPRLLAAGDSSQLAFADLTEVERLHNWAYQSGLRPEEAPVYRRVRYREEYNGVSRNGHIGFRPLRYSGHKAATQHLVELHEASNDASAYH